MKRATLALLLILPCLALAADPPAPEELVITGPKAAVPPYKIAKLLVNAGKGDAVTWKVVPAPEDRVKVPGVDGKYLQFTGLPATTYTIDVTVVNFKEERLQTASTTVAFAALPQPPPPGPQPPPGPNPPGPAPGPVTSFRVILVYESAAVTPDQKAVVFGQTVADWLDANCTGGRAGWRRRDKDEPGDQDKTMAALWAAVQPKAVNVPCVAVERNGAVELVNVEPTQAQMIDVLKRYRGN